MTTFIVAAGLAGLLATASAAVAHVTPPVILASDRDAVVELLGGARRYFVREVRLTPAQKARTARSTGWTPDADFYRFYLGREADGRLVGAVLFLTEYTVHGPVRVAVSIGPDGTIAGARVVELTEETYAWLKPLIDRDFTRAYVGRGSRARFGLTEQVTRAHLGSMPEFYAEVVASLLQRGAILFDVAGLGFGIGRPRHLPRRRRRERPGRGDVDRREGDDRILLLPLPPGRRGRDGGGQEAAARAALPARRRGRVIIGHSRELLLERENLTGISTQTVTRVPPRSAGMKCRNDLGVAGRAATFDNGVARMAAYPRCATSGPG